MGPAASLIEMESPSKPQGRTLLTFVKSRKEGAKRGFGSVSNKLSKSKRDLVSGCPGSHFFLTSL